MSKLKSTLSIAVFTFITLTAISCKDNKKEQNKTDGNHSEMNHDNSDGHHDGNKKEIVMSGSGNSETVLNDYFNLKNALVADDNAKAKELGVIMAKSFQNLDVSNYTDAQKADLKDIIEDAVEQSEHISDSDIDHQREHFKMLSKDIIDMVAVTGSENTVYQLFCPMYDSGSAWLSMSKEIKNPYYGSKMMNCGKVQKEIN
ncbi:hypothetical protein KCTC52924_03562 [Arenibacter antarcticus]|uniref:DUF3347 domain-containing protein n=1 Tax=Arenibacter antarcticus TaxID=2040469 RepID=A0ABW5VI18_9FLAO|nr:DUF3347 domain-containing protein [Arenibacter sp. H213]MCM4166622.1 hypothetical protein [Arenibacter sp. H213]